MKLEEDLLNNRECLGENYKVNRTKRDAVAHGGRNHRGLLEGVCQITYFLYALNLFSGAFNPEVGNLEGAS